MKILTKTSGNLEIALNETLIGFNKEIDRENLINKAPILDEISL